MKTIFLILFLWCLSLSSIQAKAVTLELATVARAIDGDTIELSDGRKVRYIGINTPETSHPRRGQECFGQEAKNRNVELVEGKSVTLERDVNDTDRYGRLLRYVYVDDQMVNAQLVAEGFAFSSPYPPDLKHQDKLDELQKVASEQALGLWGAECLAPDGEVQGLATTWLEELMGLFEVSKMWREIMIALTELILR